MADTSFVDNVITAANRIVSTWLNAVNKHVYQGVNPSYVTSTGSANAQTITLPSSLLAALVAGQELTWKAGFTSTSATPTLTVVGASSIGPYTMKRADGTALFAGDIVSGGIYKSIFDGTNILVNVVTMKGAITAAITGTVNDWAPTGFSTAQMIRVTASGSGFHITGIAGGAAGRLITLHNAGVWIITLDDASGSSAGANTFQLSSSYSLGVDQSVMLEYDGTTLCWRLFGQQSIGTSLQMLRTNFGATAVEWVAPVTLGTPLASTSGTSKDFTITAGTRVITVNLNGVSTNGTSIIRIQLGTGGVPTTTGYNGVVQSAGAATAFTTSSGFDIVTAAVAAATQNGSVTFTLESSATNTWIGTGLIAESNTPRVHYSAGGVPLAAALDFVRITMVNGTDAFDAGEINVSSQ